MYLMSPQRQTPHNPKFHIPLILSEQTGQGRPDFIKQKKNPCPFLKLMESQLFFPRVTTFYLRSIAVSGNKIWRPAEPVMVRRPGVHPRFRVQTHAGQ